MGKHTPGQWITREWPKPNCDGPTLKIDIEHRSLHAAGPSIATVESAHTTSEADETCRANARLISAAPDLHDAILMLLGSVDLNNGDLDDTTKDAIRQAREALQKAEGLS